jgi:hypothetical protein
VRARRPQWDPERSLQLAALEDREIQVGLLVEAVDRYIDEWVFAVADVSCLAAQIHQEVDAGDLGAAKAALPEEHVNPLPDDIRVRIGADRELCHAGAFS